MKIGTILENNYTTKENPLHYTIYLGTSNDKVTALYCYNGNIQYAHYFKNDIGEDKQIIPTRHIVSIADIISEAIASAIKEE